MGAFILLIGIFTVKGIIALSEGSISLKGAPETLIEFYDEKQVYHRLAPSEFNQFREAHADTLYLTQSSAAVAGGGIGPPLRGTLSLLATGLFIATLLGLPSAIFICEVQNRNSIAGWIDQSIRYLAGVPPIVLGLVGFCVVGYAFPVITQSEPLDRSLMSLRLPWVGSGTDGSRSLVVSFQGWGPSLITGAAILGCLTLPPLTASFVQSLRKVGTIYRENAAVLGASDRRIIWGVMIPAARFSLLADLFSAGARIIGATAALLFIGSIADPGMDAVQPVDPGWLTRIAQRLQGECHALSLHCFEVSGQNPGGDLTRPMMEATALVLIVLVIAGAALSEICRRADKRNHPVSQ